MPINRLLNCAAMPAEEIARLNAAYDRALRGLHLVDRNDPVTELVARKIIDLGATGIVDPAEIAKLAISQLNPRP